MRQIILLLFLASIVLYLPSSLADYDKNSITSEDASPAQVTNFGAREASADSSKNPSPKLYGRIEQIVQGPGAQFPVVLRTQTAKMDTRLSGRLQQSGESSFSGTIVKSFPQQFSGTWGGSLKIWTAQIDPIAWQIDSDEANNMRQLLKSGLEGTVNFNFSQDSAGAIDLEPAKVVFMIPMKDSYAQGELDKMLGQGQLGQGMTLPGMDSQQMAGMMKQLASTMKVPLILSFGTIETTPNMTTGVSGNRINSTTMKNSIRQLSPGVLEQQIVAKEVQHNDKTGQVRQEYSETVIRFTSQGTNSLYVLAATVNYTADRKFERKLILYGTVRKGQVMPDMTNPLGGLNSGFPGNSRLPQFPNGQNPFQGLFPPQ